MRTISSRDQRGDFMAAKKTNFQKDLTKFMDYARDKFKKFGKEAGVLAKKSEKEIIKASKRGKIQVDILGLNMQKEKVYYDIGKRLYELNAKKKLNIPELEPYWKKIHNLQIRARNKKRELSTVRGKKNKASRKMKKALILAVILSLGILLCEAPEAHAERISSIRDAKIKKYMLQLGDRKYAQRARIELLSEGSRAVPYLVALALEPSAKVTIRALAIRVLGDIRDSEATEPLIKALGNEHPKIRRAAAKAMGKVGDRKAVESLRNSIKDEDYKVRLNSVRSLEQIGDPSVAEALRETLKDPNRSIRLYAVKGLGKMKYKSAVKELSEMTGDKKAIMRLEVTRALGSIADTSCIPALGKLINDSSINVRLHAAKALGEIKSKDSMRILLGVINSNDKQMRYYSAIALGKLGYNEAVPELKKLIIDENTAIRVAAANSLVKIGTRDAREALRTILDDEISKVRIIAEEALKQ
jgi:HEAT repeat protein